MGIRKIFFIGVLLVAGFGAYAVHKAHNPADPYLYQGQDNPAEFKNLIDQQSANTLLFMMISAEWCDNCVIETRQLQELQTLDKIKVAVLKLDFEKYPVIAKAYMKTPHVPENHLYYRGRELAMSTGRLRSSEELRNWLELNAHKGGASVK